MKIRFSKRFRLGVIRYCHPVHQLVINLGWLYLYTSIDREPTPEEWQHCPAWRQLQQGLAAAEQREEAALMGGGSATEETD
jgi:hypothetical protein